MTVLAEKRRLVLKIGSALLVDQKKGIIRQEWLDSLCEDIYTFLNNGYDIIVVSSGAVSLARRQTGHIHTRLKLGEKQALASIGQVGIAQAWQQALERYGRISAQLLLTPDDTEDRKRHLNARRTLEAILSMGAVPIINENDAIAAEEIHFGDNDRLAARIAQMIDADALLLFSDIDGLYTADPRIDPEATHIPVVEQLTDDILAAGGDAPAGDSSGGMRTKLLAAQIATRAGCEMIITKGEKHHPLTALQEGALCTRFLAQSDIGSARKRWIASALQPDGTVTLDNGAVKALYHGASLLPAGVTNIDGDFESGAIVALQTIDGHVLGHGLIEYDANGARLMLGHHSTRSDDLLGHERSNVMIHHNNLALDEPPTSK